MKSINAPSYYRSPLPAVVNVTAETFGLNALDLRSSRRTSAISDAKRVVRLVAMDMGYTAREIGDELGTGESAVHSWKRSTYEYHVKMAREVSKVLAP